MTHKKGTRQPPKRPGFAGVYPGPMSNPVAIRVTGPPMRLRLPDPADPAPTDQGPTPGPPTDPAPGHMWPTFHVAGI
jgi:hypothetical protein